MRCLLAFTIIALPALAHAQYEEETSLTGEPTTTPTETTDTSSPDVGSASAPRMGVGVESMIGVFSGPAFVYTMVELLAQGGKEAGLPAELADQLAVHTAAGAAEMILATGDTPAVLRDRVTSPGGTTLAGLKALEENNFARAVVAAVRAATDRSVELGRSVESGKSS